MYCMVTKLNNKKTDKNEKFDLNLTPIFLGFSKRNCFVGILSHSTHSKGEIFPEIPNFRQVFVKKKK